MGKVPAIETENGFICETSVILDYLELAYPLSNSLMPNSTYEQAKVKELMQIIQLYLELPARRCFGEAFFGGQVSDETKHEVKKDLLKGIKALQLRASFSPYVASNSFSFADVVFIFSIDLASLVAKKLFGLNLLEGFDEAQILIEKLNQRPHIKSILKEKNQALTAFIEAKKQ